MLTIVVTVAYNAFWKNLTHGSLIKLPHITMSLRIGEGIHEGLVSEDVCWKARSLLNSGHLSDQERIVKQKLNDLKEVGQRIKSIEGKFLSDIDNITSMSLS